MNPSAAPAHVRHKNKPTHGLSPDPPGATTETAYDGDGDPTSITDPLGNVTETADDADGQLGTIEYHPGGLSTGHLTANRGYDAAGQVASITRKTFNTTDYTQYTRDAAGRPVTQTMGRSWPSPLVRTAESYTYRDAGHLDRACFFTSTQPAACTPDADASIGYTYDDSGNRLTETRTGVDKPGTTTTAYDAAHQITPDGTNAFTHDADGNLTSNGTTTWVYDEYNQPVTITTDSATGPVTTDLTYDATGNRRTQTDGTSTITYNWDINHPVPKLATVDTDTDAATSHANYRYDPTGAPSWANLDQGPAALITDALGSVTSAHLNFAQAPAWSTNYEPFGTPYNTTEGELTTTDVGLGYTGEYTDPTTGHINLRLRQYDPTLGRFTATDPVTTPRNQPFITPYAYVNNQPTLYTDPTGAIPNPGPGIVDAMKRQAQRWLREAGSSIEQGWWGTIGGIGAGAEGTSRFILGLAGGMAGDGLFFEASGDNWTRNWSHARAGRGGYDTDLYRGFFFGGETGTAAAAGGVGALAKCFTLIRNLVRGPGVGVGGGIGVGAGSVVTRSLDDVATLRGATTAEVESLIPPGRVKSATNANRGGPGIRYSNPEHRGEQVRIMPGKITDPNPIKQGPYMRINQNGTVTDPVPLFGNPTL